MFFFVDLAFLLYPVPAAFGYSLLPVAAGGDLLVQKLSAGQVGLGLLSGQDGLNVVVIQIQNLHRKHGKCAFMYVASEEPVTWLVYNCIGIASQDRLCNIHSGKAHNIKETGQWLRAHCTP